MQSWPTTRGGVYNIDPTPARSADDRHDTLIRLVEPEDRTLVDQRYETSDGVFVVYDRQADIIGTGNTKDYKITMSLADWDDITWSDTSDPPVHTDEEKDQKLFDLSLRILTEITNMHCEMGGATTPGDVDSFNKLESLSATLPGSALFHVTPYDVECSENVTITGVSAGSTADFIDGFDTIHIHDNDETVQDDDIEIGLNDAAQTGLSFVSSSFTVGESVNGVDRLAASDPDDVNPGGVAVFVIDYLATSEDVCTWDERSIE